MYLISLIEKVCYQYHAITVVQHGVVLEVKTVLAEAAIPFNPPYYFAMLEIIHPPNFCAL